MKNYLKKIVLLVSLSISTIVLFAQSTENVTYIQIGKIDSDGDIIWGEKEVSDLVFTYNGKHIYIDDKAKTHLYCYKKTNDSEGVNNQGDRYTSHTWDAYDEKSRKCIFSMLYFKDLKLSIYGIVYNDYAFRYFINMETLSNYKLWKA